MFVYRFYLRTMYRICVWSLRIARWAAIKHCGSLWENLIADAKGDADWYVPYRLLQQDRD